MEVEISAQLIEVGSQLKNVENQKQLRACQKLMRQMNGSRSRSRSPRLRRSSAKEELETSPWDNRRNFPDTFVYRD